MTTRRDDIAGLSERLRESPLPSLNRICKDRLEAATQLDSLLKERDALSARVKELEAEAEDKEARYDSLIILTQENFARALRAEQDSETWSKWFWNAVNKHIECCGKNHERALRAEQERDELQQVFDSRWDADQRAIKRWQEDHPDRKPIWPDHADMVVWLLERDARLQQERDEAYERAAELVEYGLFKESSATPWDIGVNYAKEVAVTAIRRLASGPEKEKKG